MSDEKDSGIFNIDEFDDFMGEVLNEEELDEILMVEPLEPEEVIQAVEAPPVVEEAEAAVATPAGRVPNRVGQTHQKYALIRKERSRKRRKYMNKAKNW